MDNDFKTVKVELTDRVAILRMDNPPVNQMSEHFINELRQAIGQALADDQVKALVLTGTGRNFVAGVDVTQLLAVREKEPFMPKLMAVHEWFNSMEQGPKPIIAALNGNCLGGGMELTMACHYRVASPDINLGLPEVKLGRRPGRCPQ